MKKIYFSITLAMLLSILVPSGLVSKADNVGGIITGQWSGSYNTLKLDKAKKGDVLLGYNKGVKYGNFSHIALVQTSATYKNSKSLSKQSSDRYKRSNGWDGLTVEATAQTKSHPNAVYTNQWQSHFRKYDAAVHAKVNLSESKKAKAVAKAKTYKGKYSTNTNLSSNSQWYCTKLITRAYYDTSKIAIGGYHDILPANTAPAAVLFDSHVLYVTGSYSEKYDGKGIFKKKTKKGVNIDAKDFKKYSTVKIKTI